MSDWRQQMFVGDLVSDWAMEAMEQGSLSEGTQLMRAANTLRTIALNEKHAGVESENEEKTC